MYNDRNIQLLNGDCLDLMNRIPDKSIDMILCDLPFGETTRNKWDSVIPFDQLWSRYNRIIKDNGAIVLFGNGMFTADLMKSNVKMWKYNLIWQKTQPTGFLNAKRMPLRDHEDICVFYKKQPTYNPQMTSGHNRKVIKAIYKRDVKNSSDYGVHDNYSDYESTDRYPKSVWLFPKDSQKSALHPTQKPVALLSQLIKTYTNEGDVVLDNCMGSGSTGVSCVETNRRFIGIEKDPEYFNVAKDRIEHAEYNN